MRITYAKTAQVAGCPPTVLAHVARVLDPSASTGDGFVMVDYDELKRYCEEHRDDESNPDINFLIEVVTKIDYLDEPIGEVLMVG